MRCERADLLATNRIRICSAGPLRVIGTTLADLDRAALAAATASVGSDLPALAPGLTVRAINLDNDDLVVVEEP